MKKIIAFVLTVAMVLSVCAFSVSAETAAPSVELQGAANAVVGDTYTVSVRLNDAAGDVAGVQGELVYANATVKDIVVNPQLLTWNNTEDDDTIVYNDGDSINFATLAYVTGTRLLIKVTFEVAAGATFSLENVKFADDNAAALAGNTGAALAPAVIATEDGVAKLNAVGMLPEADGLKQGVVVNGSITVEGVTEFGVVYYPTQLLAGKALTLETEGAVVASTTNLTDINDFDATLKFAYKDATKAAKMLGVKISAVVYYKDAEGTHYSANSVDKYIQGGVASKAVLNVALEKVAGITGDAELDAAKAGISGADMVNCRNVILAKAIAAAANAQ